MKLDYRDRLGNKPSAKVRLSGITTYLLWDKV